VIEILNFVVGFVGRGGWGG